MERPIIEIKGLLVTRNDRTILRVPELAFQTGTITSVIGPNGAGKSTLLLSLMRLVRPDSGEIKYRSQMILPGKSERNYRRNMSLVFHEPLLLNTSVYRNIATGLKIRGMGRSDIRPVVEEMLDLFGISHLADRGAKALSGGEAQRVNLARALAVRPEILLMDEPFSSLDAPTRESFVSDLERIIRGRGLTVIFATHDRNEAIRLADEIIVMNEGNIVQSGTPAEITRSPADEFVAFFVGTETILTGTIVGAAGGVCTVSVNGAMVEMPGETEPGRSVTFCIHPENIIFSLNVSETSARNSFRGKVVKTVSQGLFHKVYFDCGFILVGYVTGHSMESLGISRGKELVASFKATSVHVIKVA
jgi:tungstate transport system ATP-binding protein